MLLTEPGRQGTGRPNYTGFTPPLEASALEEAGFGRRLATLMRMSLPSGKADRG